MKQWKSDGPRDWYSFTVPRRVEGLILGPLAPQSGVLITWPLRPRLLYSNILDKPTVQRVDLSRWLWQWRWSRLRDRCLDAEAPTSTSAWRKDWPHHRIRCLQGLLSSHRLNAGTVHLLFELEGKTCFLVPYVCALVTFDRSTSPVFMRATEAHPAWPSLRGSSQWVLPMVFATARKKRWVLRSSWPCYQDCLHTGYLYTSIINYNNNNNNINNDNNNKWSI